MSIDAKTGQPDRAFNSGGRVDLKRGLGRTIDPALYAASSPPLVMGDVVIVGSAMTEGTDMKEAPPGHVRAFDVRTGELKWIFIPFPNPANTAAIPGQPMPGSLVAVPTYGP